MKENNTPLENLEDEHKMLLLRDRIRQNKWIKRLCNKASSIKIKVMTREEKELLLKDLSARLPYGVKMYCGEDIIMTLRQIDENCFCECWENEDFKCHSRWMLPYLRPMDSMTEEEKKIYIEISSHLCGEIAAKTMIDWLNKNHFDYQGLIEKGLAIAVTEDNNPYK